jgi:hypothetical protein
MFLANTGYLPTIFTDGKSSVSGRVVQAEKFQINKWKKILSIGSRVSLLKPDPKSLAKISKKRLLLSQTILNSKLVKAGLNDSSSATNNWSWESFLEWVQKGFLLTFILLRQFF